MNNKHNNFPQILLSSNEEIIKFIYEKDIFYQDDKYVNNENRDPSIFVYIPIGNQFGEHEFNINILKEKQIWNLYSSLFQY